jgi:hypothetical protein
LLLLARASLIREHEVGAKEASFHCCRSPLPHQRGETFQNADLRSQNRHSSAKRTSERQSGSAKWYFRYLIGLITVFRAREKLLLENIALRQQLLTLPTKPACPRAKA